MEASRIFDRDSLMTDVLLKKEPITSTSEVLDSLWVTSSQGSAPMVNFEGENNTDKSYTAHLDCKLENSVEDSADESFHPPEKKRRLSLNQVKFLEKSFDMDNKLEPDRKVQLAKELGLQPRQVAIWFQNRRARFKTKLLERDYDSLKASYDKMKADFDALSAENEKLKSEVHLLSQKLLVREDRGSKVESELWDPISPLDFRAREHLLSTTDVLPMVGCKQEDAVSSSKSDVFDSDSPNYCNDGNHSGALEPADSSHVDNSEFSHDDDEPPCLPKFEFDYLQPNSCNLGFLVQHQGTWLWQY